ncbi:MAG: hypothetical protein EPO02_01805 [Nitrospirae bacterium]|nr:MAG: hypothetical protein EPO02_01805 [Nitrospirota bacterium]
MDTNKLRMKIGIHEFEAEGDADIVNQKFEEFKRLVADYDATKQNHTQLGSRTTDIPSLNLPPAAPPVGIETAVRLTKVVKNEAKKPLVLSALPQGQNREGDAALVLLLAYRVFRQLELVGGSALLVGMQASGYPLARVDRPLMQRLVEATPSPLVLRSGKKRGVTYRLTTPGETRAREVVEEILAHLS